MARYKFQKNDFNPTFIISNIVILSTLYYLINIFFTILFNSFFRTKLHINQLLSDSVLDFSSKYAYNYILSILFTNTAMIFCYVFIIDKAKKILDYVLTNFFIHLILSTINDKFPSKFIWWFLHGVIITAVTLISEYISLKIEQKEIKLDFHIDRKDKKI